MKNYFKILCTVFFLHIFLINMQAQDQIVDYLQGGLEDGNTILEEYFQPFGGMLSTSLNSGWYNTAAIHKLGGFDLTFTLSAAFTPEADKTFDLNDLDLNYMELATPGDGTTPTVAGTDDKGPDVIIREPGSGIELTRFPAPEGANLKVLPLPMVQVGVGLPLHTEVMVRFLPKVHVVDYSIGLWGLGIKHSIKESLPGLKILPIDISVMIALTKLNSTQEIDYPQNTTLADPADATRLEDQKIVLACDSWTTNLLLSKKLAIITLYGGIGYNKTDTQLDFDGYFPVIINNPLDTDFGLTEVVEDPFSLNLNQGGFRMNAGLRLKLAVLTIHAEYTKVKYPVMTAGIGFSIR